MHKVDLLAIGELNPDLVLSGISAHGPRLGTEQEFGRYELTLGSSTAITCVITQRLGLATAISAWVGNDDYGRFCRAALRDARVDVALVRTDANLPTGLTVCLPYPGDRLLMTCKGAMTLNPAEGIGIDTLRRARHVHVGSFFLQDGLQGEVAALFKTARGLGLTTSLDTGWDPQERWMTEQLRDALAHTSILFANALEFDRLSGESDIEMGIARLRAFGVDTVVLKRGEDGAVYGGAEGIHASPSFAMDAIDTTGAGDAFNAGYLAVGLRGGSVAERLTFGNACGALTVAAIGGTGGVVDAAQVDAFIAAKAPANR